MSVFKQLQKARTMFLSAPIKKSGKNKFAGYEYFELGDFIPTIHNIFDSVGLCGVVRFTNDVASLTVYGDEGSIEFTSPMVYAENTKGQAIQNLGSTHTYLRRYLWLMAMEIVEHDSVDAAPQAEKPKEIKQAPPVPPKVATEDQKLFVDELILWAVEQKTASKLMEKWKSVQKDIDALKVSDPALFEHLKTCFTELKANFKE
jgi:predicted dehydrogenase